MSRDIIGCTSIDGVGMIIPARTEQFSFQAFMQGIAGSRFTEYHMTCNW